MQAYICPLKRSNVSGRVVDEGRASPRAELGDLGTKAEPTDVPINPGESVSLKIHPSQLDAWDYARRKENRPFPKHVQVQFQFLSHGDGTGYFGADGQILPRRWPESRSAVQPE
jgi:hypothetical protein